MKNLWLALALLITGASILFANGGAWQAGVPTTGNASASKNDRHTDVTIENETLKIDLHPEYAAVEVRYRMHNTGPKVQQDFFFPVERWGANPDSDGQGKSDDIDHYQITVDGKELKSTNVAGPKQESSETKEGAGEANQESSEAKEEETSRREAGKHRSGGRKQRSRRRRRRNNFGAIVARTRVHDQVMEKIGHSFRTKPNAGR